MNMPNEKNKIPDRIHISKKARDFVEHLVESNFLDLRSLQRAELFAFAMGLGVSSIPIELTEETREGSGLALDTAIDRKTKAFMYVNYAAEKLNSDTIDKVTEKYEVYQFAESCANSGFEILRNYADSNASDLQWELLRQMDDLYIKNVESSKYTSDRG